MKRKTIIIVIAGILIMAASIAAALTVGTKPNVTPYTYVTAEKRTLREDVHVSGIIVPAQTIDLSYDIGGRITKVNAQVNDMVKTGDVLVELDNAVQSAQVAQARAALDQRAAGATPQQIDVAKAGADAAKADLEKTKVDAAGSIATAQSALETAQNNLKIAQGGEDSQVVSQAYETAVATLQATLPKLDDAMTQADNVVAVDNITANISFQTVLSALDSSKLTIATNAYKATKTDVTSAHTAINSLSSSSAHTDIDAAFDSAQKALISVSEMLPKVTDVLNETVAGGVLSQTNLNAMKSAVQGARTNIAAQQSAVVAAKQATVNAKNSYGTLEIAFEKAQHDLASVKSSTDGLIKLKQSVYDQTLANVSTLTQPVRSVDLQPLRAAVNTASVAYEKTFLRAPIDGKVSRMDAKVGGIAAPSVPLASVFDANALQANLMLSETDVAKVAVGNPVDVTIDAYGTGVSFPATIVKIDPAASTVNGSTGYKVTIQFVKADERIKPGMTANASIITAEKADVVSVPTQSVLQQDGKYYVFMDGESNKPKKIEITVGIRSADNWWEVVSGVNANDRIIQF